MFPKPKSFWNQGFDGVVVKHIRLCAEFSFLTEQLCGNAFLVCGMIASENYTGKVFLPQIPRRTRISIVRQMRGIILIGHFFTTHSVNKNIISAERKKQ